MNSGKTLFAQLMDFLPWSTFTRIVSRYGGDWRVRTLSCAEQYRAMAFAQLTYRESLRDIETCLSVQAAKLYSMGFGDPVRRSADTPRSRVQLSSESASPYRRKARISSTCERCAVTRILSSGRVLAILGLFATGLVARSRNRERCSWLPGCSWWLLSVGLQPTRR